MGDGTKEKPYTRDDVLRLIQENGGKAEGLDLIGKWFENGIDLSKLDLRGAWLGGTKLDRAQFINAYLEGTKFESASLIGADFRLSHIEGADFRFAYLEGVILSGIEIPHNTTLDSVRWGNYILGDERKGKEAEKDAERWAWYMLATETYRRLKQWYTNAGMYDIAGKFFFREMTAKRKVMKWWPNPLNRAFSKLLSILCGYGEKPERVVISAAALLFVLTLVFWGLNSVWTWSAFGRSLYFSAVSFTSVGYGGWLDEKWIDITNNWIKGIGATESFLGAFMMALFLVTFTRKMTR